ncbi:Axin-2 [Liparis tanakae]|uniref:Axin-2 n=1 Tax=Liparis tanakae TaxID=230148 RepID=A0A4Z2DZ01_9TELE|nr:Axin-2 [Liparis tanakae]
MNLSSNRLPLSLSLSLSLPPSLPPSLSSLLRYYFKKASDEFECGAVFEEVWEEAGPLPVYEGKVLGKVERMD